MFHLAMASYFLLIKTTRHLHTYNLIKSMNTNYLNLNLKWKNKITYVNTYIQLRELKDIFVSYAVKHYHIAHTVFVNISVYTIA